MLKLKKFQSYMSILTKAAASILVLMLFVTGGLYGVSAMTSGAGSNSQKTTYNKQTAGNQMVSTKTSVNDDASVFQLPAAGESEASLEAFTSEAKTLAAPSQLKDNVLSDTKVKLTWNKVDHATVYFIYRKPLEGSYELIKKVHNTYWTDTVSSGQVYMYKVKAVDRTGSYQKSKASKSLVVFMPTRKVSVQIASRNKKAYLTWKAVPNADKYLVYKSTDSRKNSAAAFQARLCASSGRPVSPPSGERIVSAMRSPGSPSVTVTRSHRDTVCITMRSSW